MTPTERLLSRLPDAKRTANGWSACCPAHEDRRASLAIVEGDHSGAVLHCHAGCEPSAVVAALGLTLADLMPPRIQSEPARATRKPAASDKPPIMATYNYRDETGKTLFQVIRYEPKGFRQRRPKSGGGWEWSVKGVRVVPYRLPELLADAAQAIMVVEGEKDADRLADIGVLATCNAGGAGKWTAAHAEFLRGRRAVVLPDNDEPGRKHAQQVAQSLHGIAESVRIVELPGLPPKGDVSDWIAAGGTKEGLERLAEASSLWSPVAATEAWPEILAFDAVDLPDFPTDALPSVLRQWVEAESHATQTPPDLAGLLALAVCSATIARRVVVEPHPGWQEPANLYVAVLLEPGNRKSAVFGNAIGPLRELEAELIEEVRPEVAKRQSERRQLESRLRKLEKLAAENGDAEARQEAGKLAVELAKQAEPVMPRLIVDDATSEKIGMILAEQGGRIASMSPEGGVFDLMAGLYSKSGVPQFDVYLKGHSGDDLATDRVSRGTVRVVAPALTCAYAMQPAVITGLAEKAAFRGRGLLARFLYAAPKSWIGGRQIASAPVSEATREAYRQTVRMLTGLNGERVLRLGPDATEVLQNWEAEIEEMLGDGGLLETMRDWGAKLAGATLRIAAVLHCIEHGELEFISGATVTAAVKIARYLIPHAEAVLALMQTKETPREDDARYVLRWIERHSRREFTKRDVHQHGKRRFPKADNLDQALAELTRRGYIRLRPSDATGPGRPPSPSYEVNPATFGTEPTQGRSRNSLNAASESDGGNSGNIGNGFEQTQTVNRILVTI